MPTASSAPVSMSAASPVVDIDLDTTLDEDRPRSLVVWDDPFNTMIYVTMVFQRVLGYDLDTATTLMLQVHHQGRAEVKTGGRAELEPYRLRLHDAGLLVTIEER